MSVYVLTNFINGVSFYEIMQNPHNIEDLYTQIKLRKGAFLWAFFVVMVISYGILVMIDFVPEPVEQRHAEAAEVVEVVDEPVVEAEPVEQFPVSIHFDSLDKTVAVLNPTSRSIADLDAALLDGVVRHPDSADFHEVGNIFILGHSSYLPNVFNKNYQAFNDIQKLTWGDTIRLRSKDMEYVYTVDRVYKAKASEVVVPNSRGEAKLTLATCNSFGSKDDRFIVEASLVSTKAL